MSQLRVSGRWWASLTDSQRGVALAVGRVGANWATAKGVPVASVVGALWANGQAESGLSTAATGDSGRSIGVFQFNTGGGLGSTLLRSGWTVAQIRAADSGAAAILWEWERVRGLAGIRSDCATPASAAASLCRYAERPRDIAGESAKRAQLAAFMVPT